MRTRISERNMFPVFSLDAEYHKLHDLFFDKREFGILRSYGIHKEMPSLSYNDCLQSMFLDWDLRGSFTSLEEMLVGLSINEDDFDKDCSEERLLDYIQFILNAIIFVKVGIKKGDYSIYQDSVSIANAIFDNSRLILDKLGAEMVDADAEIVIVYKNDVATAISIQHPDIAASITDYLKIDNRGDLHKKGEILCTLAKKLEPMEKKFQGTEFNGLCSNTTLLFNKTGVRHALDPNDKIEAKFKAMDQSELELWYDRAFQLFLACMSVYPYLEIKDEINAIKI